MQIELNDNKITGDLTPLTAFTGIDRIVMENNSLTEIKQLEPLVLITVN